LCKLSLQLRDSVIEYFDFLQNQTLLRRKKNPQDSRERNMMSKFLCYRYDFACSLTNPEDVLLRLFYLSVNETTPDWLKRWVVNVICD
jgi:hypothetical protein